MSDQVQALAQTSDTGLPADLSVHQAAELLAQYRTAPEAGPAATENAESVIEKTPDQDQPALESSEEGSQEEVTEEVAEEFEDDEESLADSESDQPDESEDDADADAVYEIDGEEYTLQEVKEWRESGMRHDDYQRKTQVLAQQREAITGLEENLNQFAHAQQRMFQARTAKIQEAIKQYSSVDWPKLAQEDQQQFTVHNAQFNQLKDQLAQEQRQFQTFAQEFQKLSDMSLAKKAEAAWPEIKQRVKGFNEARYHELREFLSSELGADQNNVNRITDPWFWELANDAYTYRKGKSLQTGKKKIRRPTKTLKAKAPAKTIDVSAKREQESLQQIANAGSARSQMELAADLMARRRGKG